VPFQLTIWDYAAALPLGIWLYLLLARGGYWRTRIAGQPGNLPDPLPRVAVIVPARDEEDCIKGAAASLACQDYPGEFAVRVVDDHSTDATAERARRAGDSPCRQRRRA
jgi:cellulose synthase/poly-beta-1,6-N-acetylglucosamine synthase-like glycosyltransferase